MKQQRAQTREQKSRRYIQTCDQRHHDSCAKHSKHMLKTQYDHLSRAEFARVIDRPLANFVITTHLHFLLLNHEPGLLIGITVMT